MNAGEISNSFVGRHQEEFLDEIIDAFEYKCPKCFQIKNEVIQSEVWCRKQFRNKLQNLIINKTIHSITDDNSIYHCNCCSNDYIIIKKKNMAHVTYRINKIPNFKSKELKNLFIFLIKEGAAFSSITQNYITNDKNSIMVGLKFYFDKNFLIQKFNLEKNFKYFELGDRFSGSECGFHDLVTGEMLYGVSCSFGSRNKNYKYISQTSHNKS